MSRARSGSGQLVSWSQFRVTRFLRIPLHRSHEASLDPTDACSSRSGTARHICGGPEEKSSALPTFHPSVTLLCTE
jgi:hypothetical protein